MSAAVALVREAQETYGAEPWLDRHGAHEALVTLARRRAADDAAMLEPLLVAEETRAHDLLGLGSFKEYCARLFGWGGRQTRERLRVARAMRELPQMRARWANGELTYSVVRELTRVATPEVEEEWLTWATGGTAGSIGSVRRTAREVQRMVATHGRGSSPSDPPLPFAEQTVRISLEVSGNQAARFAEARTLAARMLGEAVDDETLARMLFDAFFRDDSSAADVGVAPNQVKLTVCERCRATEREAGAEGLVEVDPRVGEVALCDAQLLRDGERAKQTVPPAARREVVRRDEGKCVVPGCRHGAFVEVHHLERQADGGDHDPANLLSLCSVHHDAAHEGRLVIRRAEPGDGEAPFRFERADGRPYGSLAGSDELRQCETLARAFEEELERSGHEGRARQRADQRVRLLRTATGAAEEPGVGRSTDGRLEKDSAVNGSVDAAHVGREEEKPKRSEDLDAVDDATLATPAHVGRVALTGPRFSRALGERVVRLLTAMGYTRRVSRQLLRAAVAAGELPTGRSPTTEELLRASLRCG